MQSIGVRFRPDVTPLGIRPITSVPGVTHVQVARMMVSIDDLETEHVVVNTFPVKADHLTCRGIADEVQHSYPDAVISFLLEYGEGSAIAFTRESDTHYDGIAVAVSCHSIACGWDESPTFEIRVNDRFISLPAVRFDGFDWR